MKKLSILSVVVFICCNAFSQNETYNWALGNSAGLSFLTGSPEYFSTNLISFECNATISDSAGNLLFYTNGNKVWNKMNEVMPNGDSLNIGGRVGTYSISTITQGVIIVPNPGISKQYLITYLTDDYEGSLLQYSVVDMNMEGGKGNVIEKNLPLDSTYAYTEKMQAVKHGNGRDWWLILYGMTVPIEEGNPMYWIKYLITDAGIEGPNLQESGTFYEEGYMSGGQMKFSQDGSKLICTRGNDLDIYDFDRCNGNFSNLYTIDTVTTGYNNYLYSCEFSSDNRIIYVAPEWNKPHIYQYCLACPEEIKDTKTVIYKIDSNNHNIGAFQIAPDNKIYISMPQALPGELMLVNQNLSVINNPNELGLACDLDTLSIWLEGRMIEYGLPNMPNYNLGALIGSECDTLLAINNTPTLNNAINIYPNPATNNLIIEYSGNDEATIEIINIEGEIIYNSPLTSHHSQINVSKYASGIYLVEIISGEGKYSKKVFLN